MTNSEITLAITVATIIATNVRISIALTPFTQTEASGPDNGRDILAFMLKKFNATLCPLNNSAGIFYDVNHIDAAASLTYTD